MNKIVCLSLILLFICSCNDDDQNVSSCENGENIGDFFLLDSSKEFLPYGDEELVLIFSDSLGNEFKGKYIPGEFNQCLTQSSYSLDPNVSGSPFCDYIYQAECSESLITFDDFEDIEIQFSMRVNAIFPESREELVLRDFFTVSIFNNAIQSSPSIFVVDDGFLPILIDDRGKEQSAIEFLFGSSFNESFQLHNKMYSNVYSPMDNELFGDKEFDLFYSKELGLVGVESEDISLKFERIE